MSHYWQSPDLIEFSVHCKQHFFPIHCSVSCPQLLPFINILEVIILFSKHHPSGPMLSISQNVRVSVCSLMRYRLNVFLPPLLKVGCSKFLEIRNPWGKVMERSGLRFEHFSLEVVQNRRDIFFFFRFCNTKHVENHAFRWMRDLWSKGISLILAYLQMFLSFCVLEDFLRFSKKWVFGYSWSTLPWYKCYYPHRSRDALSPVCGIFFLFLSLSNLTLPKKIIFFILTIYIRLC